MEPNHETDVIKRQIEQTRTTLSQKVKALEQQVERTVQGAADTVENIKKTFDIRNQVANHPWGMMAGSMATGFLSGMLLRRAVQAAQPVQGPIFPERAATVARPNGNAVREYPGADLSSARSEAFSTRPQTSWLGQLGTLFEGEIGKLKGTAIGTMIGAVRDLISESLPEHLRPRLEEMAKDITVKLGGEPVRGPILTRGSTDPHGSPSRPERAGVANNVDPYLS